MAKNDVSAISNYGSYDIDTLISIWDRGWQQLRDLADHHLNMDRRGYIPPPEYRHHWSRDLHFAAPDNCLTHRIERGFYDMVCQKVTEREGAGTIKGAIDLAAAPPGKYSYPWPRRYTPESKDNGGSEEDDNKLRKLLQKVTKAYATSRTFGEAISQVTDAANVKRFTEAYSAFFDNACERVMSTTIDAEFAQSMRWLEYGLKNKEACEEAWWNCVWIVATPLIEKMLEIKRCIDMDVPPSTKQIKVLNEHIHDGFPSGRWIVEEEGRQCYRIILETPCCGGRA